MEPVDPRLSGALGEGSAGPDELRAIVARAGRRIRIRSAAVAGAVALVAGGGVGYAVSLTGSSGQKVVATAPLSGNGAQPSGSYRASAGAASVLPTALPAGVQFTPLLNRHANGVDIRGFLIGSSAKGTATCGDIGPRFQAELSTQKMVGIAGSGFIPQQLGQMILTEQPSVIGEAEGDPVAVIVLQTNSSVSEVRMAFTGGNTDSMEPVKGWSVLIAPMPSLQTGKMDQVTIGTLTALDSSGHALASTPVTWPPVPVPVPVPAMGGAVGSASGSAGTGGTATAGSGTVSSGIATYPCPPPPAPLGPGPVVTCVPPTTVQGQIYACATPAPAPASEPTSTFPKGSGG